MVETKRAPADRTAEAHWSGRRDLNPRPPAPHAGALPDCATTRNCQESSDRRQRPSRHAAGRATGLRHYSKLSTQIDDAAHARPQACGMRYRTAPLPEVVKAGRRCRPRPPASFRDALLPECYPESTVFTEAVATRPLKKNEARLVPIVCSARHPFAVWTGPAWLLPACTSHRAAVA